MCVKYGLERPDQVQHSQPPIFPSRTTLPLPAANQIKTHSHVSLSVSEPVCPKHEYVSPKDTNKCFAFKTKSARLTAENATTVSAF